MTGVHGAGLAAGAVIVATVLWTGIEAQQEVLPKPGFGSGVMSVNVVNHPAVTAAQSGEWRVTVGNVATVRLAEAATVRVAGPLFAARGSRYTVTWAAGETETITVSDIAEDGWVRVENTGRQRWVNLRHARAVEEAR